MPKFRYAKPAPIKWYGYFPAAILRCKYSGGFTFYCRYGPCGLTHSLPGLDTLWVWNVFMFLVNTLLNVELAIGNWDKWRNTSYKRYSFELTKLHTANCYFDIVMSFECCRLENWLFKHFGFWDTCTKLVPIGNTEARNSYYVTNGVTVGRRSFCLHTFGIFREDKMSLIQSKCMYFVISL